MTDVIIDYEQIISRIGFEIQNVWEKLVEDKNTLMESIKSIEISDEQYFRKQEANRNLKRGTVYLVVRFSSGAINYGASVVPISIYGLGVANQVKPVQFLLSVFASEWTTKNLAQGLEDVGGNSLELSDAIQVWNTPEVISNFNIVDEDFRNLYRVSGRIVKGQDAVRLGTLTYYFKNDKGLDDSETVDILAFQDGYGTSFDSQPFGNTKGFTQTEVNFSSYTFTVTTYLLNNHLSAAALAIRGFRNRTTTGIGAIFKNENDTIKQKDKYFNMHKNEPVKIKIQFNNGYTNMADNSEQETEGDDVLGSDFFEYYKITNSQIGQQLGDIPTLSITFTR